MLDIVSKMVRKNAAMVVVGVVFALGGGAFGEVIRLQSRVMVESRQDVRLGDIATITGADARRAEELSNMIILSSAQRTQKVKAESILIAVMAQRGSGMGNIQISGAGECEIVINGNTGSSKSANTPAVAAAAPAAEKVLTAMSAASVQAVVAEPVAAAVVAAPVAAVVPSTAGMTLEAAVVALIQKQVGLPLGDYEVAIESNSPQLKKEVAAGRQWVCRTMSKTILGTVQVEAQLMEGMKVMERLNVLATVRKLQTVYVTTKKLTRGEIVTEEMIRSEPAMLDRKLPTLFTDAAAVVGLEAQKDIEVGEKMDQRDFKPALMVHKNEVVTVVYVSGAFQMQLNGRAMEDGKMKDRIQIRNDSSGQQFAAVMIGKGVGVVGGTLTEAQEKKLLEALR